MIPSQSLLLNRWHERYRFTEPQEAYWVHIVGTLAQCFRINRVLSVCAREVSLVVLEHLFVIEKKVSLAVENFGDGCGIDLVVVAPEPLVAMLSDVGRVMAGFNVPDVIDHGE